MSDQTTTGVEHAGHQHQKGSFASSLGFILASAGSAVGLGNLWRFPYVAAKDGGGLFLAIYLVLVVTLGYSLMTSEFALGRRTRLSALNAFGAADKRFGFVGKLAFIVPAIILTYYLVIGGWVLRYLVAFVTGAGTESAADGFFTSFITSPVAPIVFALVFLALTTIIIAAGVEKGIERTSKFFMPFLVLLAIVIAGFALTLSYTDADGVTRTGLDGLAIYVIPNLENVTLGGFLSIVMDAVGQAFFSLSLAMGIMVTYASYMRKEDDLSKNAGSVVLFDTIVAFIAGVMIVPSVFVFMGMDGLTAAGPSLMFISLPKVFAAMGPIGGVVGALFFIMVAVAALTSCVSIMEVVVAGSMEAFHSSRKKMSLAVLAFAAIGAVVVCLGYNAFYFELLLPNGSYGQILDLFDYISNYVLMPIVAIATCILVGWVLKPKWVEDEVSESGHRLLFRTMYIVMVRYVAPILLVVLLVQKVLGL